MPKQKKYFFGFFQRLISLTAVWLRRKKKENAQGMTVWQGCSVADTVFFFFAWNKKIGKTDLNKIRAHCSLFFFPHASDSVGRFNAAKDPFLWTIFFSSFCFPLNAPLKFWWMCVFWRTQRRVLFFFVYCQQIFFELSAVWKTICLWDCYSFFDSTKRGSFLKTK